MAQVLAVMLECPSQVSLVVQLYEGLAIRAAPSESDLRHVETYNVPKPLSVKAGANRPSKKRSISLRLVSYGRPRIRIKPSSAFCWIASSRFHSTLRSPSLMEYTKQYKMVPQTLVEHRNECCSLDRPSTERKSILQRCLCNALSTSCRLKATLKAL